MKRMTTTLLVLGIACWSGAALAEETAKPAGKAAIVVDLGPIKGRVARPQAVVDVAPTAMKRPVADVRQPFVARIERAAEGAPF